MLRDITLGQFYPIDSPLHRRDPRSKIVATMLFSTTLFLLSEYHGLILMAAILLFAGILSRIPLAYQWRGIRPVLFLLLITGLINLFLTPGDPVWHFGVLAVTREGINLAIINTSRLLLLVAAGSLLTLTTSPIDLTDGMERLLSPFRRIGVPAHELALMMGIALRFIPTLADEMEQIMRAQAARGAEFSGNIVARMRAMIPILIPLFVSAFRRADELAIAMDARGYRGGEGRTRMRELQFQISDVLMLGMTVVLLVTAIGWGR